MTCNVGTPGLVLTVWVVAGLLSLAGALTYGELCAMMPRAGGEYVFMREAYGRLWGFLFGWMRFFIGNTGGMAALATGLRDLPQRADAAARSSAHAVTLDLGGRSAGVSPACTRSAIGAVVARHADQLRRRIVGGRIASVLTSLKVVLIVGVGTAALAWRRATGRTLRSRCAGGACEGVSARRARRDGRVWRGDDGGALGVQRLERDDVCRGRGQDPRRNLPRALIGGLGIVGLLYVFVNTAYFYVLAPAADRQRRLSSSVATEVMARVVGPGCAQADGRLRWRCRSSARCMSASLVCARVPYAMANDGLFFAALAPLSPRTSVPVRALFAQAAWTIVLVLSGSFDTLTDYAIFAILLFWGMATGLGVHLPAPDCPTSGGQYRTCRVPGRAGAVPAGDRLAAREHRDHGAAPGAWRVWP